MKRYGNILFAIIVAAVLPALLLCCTKEGTDIGSDIVRKDIGIHFAGDSQTKAEPYQYDTASVSGHPLAWNEGDRIWCYSQSGIYMDSTVTLVTPPAPGEYPGQRAKVHIVYRYGDSWVVCYGKGAAIGDYIGVRKEKLLVLENGIPRVQNGRFEDNHICISRSHPNSTDFEFRNVQAFIRFEITQSGTNRNGKLMGNDVTKLTVRSLTAGDRMCGNVELVDNGLWRTYLQDRGEPADTMITVIPDGGRFLPSPDAVNLQNYYVAIPAQLYSEGIHFDLYTVVDGEEEVRGYVDIPPTTVSGNHILNCHDLLKYCAIYVTGISLEYGDETVTEIDIAAGHSGRLVADISPDEATDKALLWEVSDDTVCTLAQDGTVTGLTSGIGRSCTVTCTARDRGTVKNQVTVNVVPDGTLGPGQYVDPGFEWPVE